MPFPHGSRWAHGRSHDDRTSRCARRRRDRSFTAAADLLGYTQSAVSRQVAAAELAVRVPPFVREAPGRLPR
ncbi:helix-turn-helix domain-containing protein [Promicromonospora sp. MS192]|uniref:helix-turn-helix domain-containing protein n=1 Tax=Promicromonospora sp. MS192 TaxID=3412684 RepID=UPI003C2D6D4F